MRVHRMFGKLHWRTQTVPLPETALHVNLLVHSDMWVSVNPPQHILARVNYLNSFRYIRLESGLCRTSQRKMCTAYH